MVTKSDYVDAKDASLDASVVILTYNGEQHIDEILASLTGPCAWCRSLTASSGTARPVISARTWPRAASSPT